MWIMGPSYPAAIPDETDRMTPIVLIIKTRMLNDFFVATPFRYALTSGIPEPPASG
jgi:hypothetical protein